MDKLDDLPMDNAHKSTPAELEALKKYFGAAKHIPSRTWEEIKCIAIATILFLAMSTSMFERLLDWIPYMDHTAARIGMRALIFASILYIGIVLLS